MRPGLKKSLVWEHFTKMGTFVVCNICKKELKFSGNTSNLNDHLRRRHPGSIKEKDADKVQRDPGVLPPTPSGMQPTVGSEETLRQQTPGPSNHAHTKTRKTLQTKLLVSDKRSELSELEKQSIDDSLIKMIVVDLQPLSLVENEGFIEYSNKMQPLYPIPNRKLLSNTMLPMKYNVIAEKLRSLLEKVTYIAITTDMWTSDSNRAFLTVTGHFISDSKMNSAVLSTKEVPEKHTAENIAEALKKVFENWSITKKVVTIVSDNGANIKKAIEILKKHHHPCVAHTLNLCVVDAIKNISEISRLLIKCRTIVTHFSHSTVATEKLKSMQRQMGLSELKVKQDVPTRWNSSLIMMERLFSIKEPLSAAIASLPNAPEFLNSFEWDMISDCIAILKPMECMTTELSGEKYPTMSLIIPLIRGLQFTIRNQMITTSCGERLKGALLDVINRRLGILETDKTCARATFLDPRFKKIAFANDSNANNAQKWVTEEISLMLNKKNIQNKNVEEEITPVQEQQTHPKALSLWTMLDQKVAEAKTTISNAPSVMANLSMEQYLRTEQLDRSKDPLTFWSFQENLLPELFQLSRKYLCIPATSVPSERIFSKAGQIINDRRNRLKGEKLDHIIFLNGNLGL